MAISFEKIPVGWRVPGQYVEYNNERATSALDGMPSRAVILAQMADSGTAAANTALLTRNADQAGQLFGVGSMAWAMVAAFKKANTTTELWVVGIPDDPAGTKATGAITIATAPTNTGTLVVTVSGARIRLKVTATDSLADVAAALAAEINGDAQLPVTAAVDGVDPTKVILTCKWAGQTGNDIDLRGLYYADAIQAPGVTMAFTAMAGGAGNPEIDEAIAALGDRWYSDAVMAYQDSANILAMDAEVERRRGPMVAMDMHCWSAHAGSYTLLYGIGMARNTSGLTTMATTGSPVPPWIWAAAYGGQATFHLKQDPGRPLQTLEIPGVLAPADKDQLGPEERNVLLHSGIATFTTDGNSGVAIERAITGYRVNKYGFEDKSYLDCQTLRLLANLSFTTRARIAQRFPRHKLREDREQPPAPGTAVATPRVIKGELSCLYDQWAEAEWIESADQLRKDAIVQINADDRNTVDTLLPPDIINQFRVFKARIDFIL
ncbi:phage tail sheath subtilisin-like domain-containing protein [Rhodospirillum sp. A1_3_36]|uniref:phage tail sheath subtilisin-like domain-containing protein n=1 Tax=Rhodospirillum sp. A1_3_36 TaxID=3391666 RepID=UPI0039A6033B